MSWSLRVHWFPVEPCSRQFSIRTPLWSAIATRGVQHSCCGNSGLTSLPAFFRSQSSGLPISSQSIAWFRYCTSRDPCPSRECFRGTPLGVQVELQRSEAEMENGTGLGDEVCEGDSPLEGVGTVSPIGELTIQFIEPN